METEVTKVQTEADLIVPQIIESGGGTVWRDIDESHARYVVGDGRRGIRCDASAENVRRWITVACVHTFHGDEGVGFWIDNGTLYIDPIRSYETFRAAEIQAQRNGEKAIWDRELQREIAVSQVSAHVADDS